MTFNEGMQIDSDGVSSGGGGFGRGPKMALGGVGGLIVVVIGLFFGVDLTDGGNALSGGQSQPGAGQPAIEGAPAHCKTGADANKYDDCRVVATAQSLNAVWSVQLPKQTGKKYVKPKVVLFTNQVNTACGAATSDVGPFYCPADQTAYFDVSFFKELTTRFGASGGPLAQEYVVAHEWGHHIQTLLGDIGRAQRDPRGPESGAVRTELQADCYAGIWAYYADKQPSPGGGQPFLNPLTDKDIRDALSAANAVGDDRIQRSAGRGVNPESWTHGSSEQRQKWFLAGYKSGAVSSCDTYSANDLNNPPGLR
ncbi:KPN_02809 family neutral zinc metallopeptidase [Nocardia camponoti]|uniref:Metalloprotease n=1 Tax=Nocardia camponoti TaxID=1616106 RepID=A0A917QA68_9NOCA|nr:neutral zinc metallopeptidase [Nocardia camponoti]GGK39619.1 hypothetical protein GCM10011591_09150 [Nocardia camponoti]